MKTLHTLGGIILMGFIEQASPLFLILGIIVIGAFVYPIIMGWIDDMHVKKIIKKNKKKDGSMPSRWKCTCGALLVSHEC